MNTNSNYMTLATCLTLATLTTACSAERNAQTVQEGPYSVSVATDPSPLQVGTAAHISARVSKNDQASADCQLRMRQFMPEHVMSDDHTWHEMDAKGKGRYTGQSGEFSMGGDWELEFELHCEQDTVAVRFPYHLEWPE